MTEHELESISDADLHANICQAESYCADFLEWKSTLQFSDAPNPVHDAAWKLSNALFLWRDLLYGEADRRAAENPKWERIENKAAHRGYPFDRIHKGFPFGHPVTGEGAR